jgi:hypothetical protein
MGLVAGFHRPLIVSIGAVLLIAVSPSARAAPRPVLENSGFVARAQRAELVVIGQTGAFGKGILGGCSVDIWVEKVLRGKLDGSHGNLIRLTSADMRDNCPPIWPGRWILAFDVHPRKVLPSKENFPAGLSWRLPIDDKGYVRGEILRSHGVTLTGGGAAANNELERMALLHLEGYLRMSPRALCENPRPSPSAPRRTIAGQVVYASGEPRRAELEMVPVGEDKPVSRVSTDEQGRFRIAGAPGGPVWLRSPESTFIPFLLPASVRRVRVVSWSARP